MRDDGLSAVQLEPQRWQDEAHQHEHYGEHEEEEPMILPPPPATNSDGQNEHDEQDVDRKDSVLCFLLLIV